ncbi:MAG: DUF4856 domain-containing protein [Weeksellaceae bacterium]
MKRFYSYIILALALLISSCDDRIDETVESAYLEPIVYPYQYKFSRNGSSSIDVLKKDMINTPIDYIYGSYLKQARILSEYEHDVVMGYYQKETEGGIILEDEVASSPIHERHRQQIKADILSIIEASEFISGYPKGNSKRRQSAILGSAGYIGNNILDLNLAYVDEKGLVVAEAFRKMLLGAIHLDKIMNLHLDESILTDKELRKAHENVELVAGKNYTALEHHWDLAFGYYSNWKAYAQPEGLIALKDSDKKLLDAFVLGRHELGRYQYDEVQKHLEIIREELSKVVAIRTINLLIGQNTIANIREDAAYSFLYLSEAYGLIYALQFTRNSGGDPYMSYEEVKEMQEKLLQDDGLWDVERLLEDENVEGSLKNISKEIATIYNISLDNVKR